MCRIGLRCSIGQFPHGIDGRHPIAAAFNSREMRAFSTADLKSRSLTTPDEGYELNRDRPRRHA